MANSTWQNSPDLCNLTWITSPASLKKATLHFPQERKFIIELLLCTNQSQITHTFLSIPTTKNSTQQQWKVKNYHLHPPFHIISEISTFSFSFQIEGLWGKIKRIKIHFTIASAQMTLKKVDRKLLICFNRMDWSTCKLLIMLIVWHCTVLG